MRVECGEEDLGSRIRGGFILRIGGDVRQAVVKEPFMLLPGQDFDKAIGRLLGGNYIANGDILGLDLLA
jgi:hypothetical protein